MPLNPNVQTMIQEMPLKDLVKGLRSLAGDYFTMIDDEMAVSLYQLKAMIV